MDREIKEVIKGLEKLAKKQVGSGNQSAVG